MLDEGSQNGYRHQSYNRRAPTNGDGFDGADATIGDGSTVGVNDGGSSPGADRDVPLELQVTGPGARPRAVGSRHREQ